MILCAAWIPLGEVIDYAAMTTAYPYATLCRPVLGEHDEGCSRSLVDCRGCAGPQADAGALCSWCRRALGDALGERETGERPDGPVVSHGVAWLHERLGHELVPGGSGEGPAAGAPGPRPPARIEVLDLRREVEVRLRAAVGALAAAGRRPPAVAWPSEAAVARYVLRHVDHLATLPTAATHMRAMTDAMRRGALLVPWRPRARRVGWLPCPACGLRDMHDDRDPELWCRSCGHLVERTDLVAVMSDTLVDLATDPVMRGKLAEAVEWAHAHGYRLPKVVEDAR